jgi:peptidoglycan/xylan/chitin deacetylase (PgdA/CDA1 family)
MNRYGLKGTFNLNSSGFGKKNILDWNGRKICRDKIEEGEVKDLYEGHEVASHTVHHYNLNELPEQEILQEIVVDQRALEKIVGYEVRGFAYPFGIIEDRVVETLKKTNLVYARTVTGTNSFEMPKNLLRLDPTARACDWGRVFDLAEKFLALTTEEPQMFYLWDTPTTSNLLTKGGIILKNFVKCFRAKTIFITERIWRY